MKKRSELFFSFILVPIDCLMVVAGFILAYIVRVKIDVKPTAFTVPAYSYFEALLLLIPVWILLFALLGLYNLSSTRNRLTELVKVLVATASGTMVLVIIDFFSISPLFPSKSVPVYGFIFSFILIYLARIFIRVLQRFLFRFSIGVHNVVVMGDNSEARTLIKQLNNSRTGYRVINHKNTNHRPWNLARIEQLYSTSPIDEIIQVDDKISDKDLLEIIHFSDQNHIVLKYVPTLAGLYRSRVSTSTLAGVPVVELIQTPLEGWGRIIKRIFDVICSLVGLLLLSPIMAAIAVAIKLNDPGPVFFRHKRISKNGKEIYIIKFRTMYVRYSDGGKFSGKSAEEILSEIGDEELVNEFKRNYKLKNDPRVTSLGRFLRRSSLDEIPQLINVLVGQLSLVGPRPIVSSELKKYGDKAARLLSIKPGLTGLWQVSGRNDISYDERAKLELYYVENWSLLMDLRIIWRTAVMIVRGSNGY